MNWKQWMKAVIQYKNTNKSDADKYLEFQTWCEKIQLDGEFDITSVEKDLKNIVGENFNQNKEQIGDSYGLIQKVLKEFSEYVQKKDQQKFENVIDVINKINKFIDDTALKMMGETTSATDNNTIPDSYDAAIDRIKESVRDLKKDVDKYGDIISGNTTSIIITTVEILGIFVAIAFALFGIFDLVAKTIAIANVSIPRIIFIVSILGFILFNTIFLLLYAIAKLTDKSIAMNCTKNKDINAHCHSCQKTKWLKWYCKLKQKFTYILAVNILCIMGIIVPLILQFWVKW